MPDARFAILDPAAGISGDMVLGALIAAGASPDWLRRVPARLGFPEVRIEIERVDRCGIAATKVDVVLPGNRREHPSEMIEDHHIHGHDHGHNHDEQVAQHDHRRFGDLIGFVRSAQLSPWVMERAVQTFTLLGQA